MNVESKSSTMPLQDNGHVVSDLKSEDGHIDWEGLRQASLQPGGFGEERVTLWPKLLRADPAQHAAENKAKTKPGEQHPDEGTIEKDTNRSFVMYPTGAADYQRDKLKDGLHRLLVSIFRRRPKLSYFQGYHDIASVIFLTLPPELHLACMEKLSLYRLRDCMVSDLDPVVGLLRVTSSLLRLADVEYANILHESSPLPFYSLANLMTLFSHDMPTLNLIQHVFDYLLCRPPIAVVYLVVSILLSRKSEVLRLQKDGDEGMIHSLLNALPDIVDETPLSSILGVTPPINLVPEISPPITEEVKDVKIRIEENTGEPILDSGNSIVTPEASDDKSVLPLSVGSSAMELPTTLEESTTSLPSLAQDASRVTRRLSSSRSASRSKSPGQPRRRSRSSTLSPSRGGAQSEVVSCLPHLAGLPAPDDDESSKNDIVPVRGDGDCEGHRLSLKPQVALSDLLRQADELYRKFPPDHRDLKLSTIMGPQSVIFTWGEDEGEEGEDRDAEAESMVLHPELIVYPIVPEREGKEGEVDLQGKRGRRKLHRPRRLDVGTKTMVAGAIVVLTVAMAVYGIRAQRRGGGSAVMLPQIQKKWTQSTQWFGSALAGASVKWMDELGLGNGAWAHVPHGEL